ncbi:monovalent cation/H(+) antiporter subunit G [Humidisolicoccus flavus]|uniref:monovalent cation/H(+) antiporter subunit G n=1 Tax=Humidisolicoccus flavus TaxID=3111414 RepID=UPI0032503062
MTFDDIMQWIGAIFILLGAALCFVGALGLVRLADVLNRMHAATKPQTLGLVLVTAGLGLSLQDPAATGMLLLVATIQLLTAPVAAQMVARVAYRTGAYRKDLIDPDPDETEHETETQTR